MGIETAIIIGLTALAADAKIGQANKQANAVVDEGRLAAANKAAAVKSKASRAKVSFLNSGLELEGTPIAALTGIFDAGVNDINRIAEGANIKASNITSAARAQAISSLAMGVAMGAMGGGGSPTMGGDAFSAGTAASTTAGGIRLPAGLPPAV